MRNTFDITPEQYHAGLDKLWKALGVTGPQDKDAFTLAAEAIVDQRERICYLEHIAFTVREVEHGQLV